MALITVCIHDRVKWKQNAFSHSFTGADSISICEQGELSYKARNHKTKAVIADEI